MTKIDTTDPVICDILIVDDHASIAHLLAEFIEDQSGFRVSKIAHDAVSALEACAEEEPDLVILDIGLPERVVGLELLGRLRQLYPEIKILVFSALSTMQVVEQALQLGANGFLEKSARFPELLIALKLVGAGQTYLGKSASEMVRELVVNKASNTAIPAQDLEALQMLSRGNVVKEIATKLQISPSMVYKIIERLRQRFSAKTNEDLISQAIDRGIIHTDPAASWPGHKPPSGNS